MSAIMPDLAWSVFIDKYKPFIEARAAILEKSSGGRYAYDDAVQEIHQAVWESVNHPDFGPNKDWMAWLYKRVRWRTLQLVRALTAKKNSCEVLADIGGDSEDGPSIPEPSDGGSFERQLEARDWIERAVEIVQGLPLKHRTCALAILVPDEMDRWANSPKRRAEKMGEGEYVRAKFEVANRRDLVEYTGYAHAPKFLRQAIAYVERDLGCPIEGTEGPIASLENTELL